jgi:3',5'-cyclic AMP phosphodiesterase CpdA
MARPLEFLFPVSFSDLDFRAIPYVAQLVDALEARLTLLHVRPPEEEEELAEERLHSFFAEAARYPHCERLVVTGDLVEVVSRRCASKPVDLLLLPASEPVWLPRLGHPSLRLALLEATRLPVWTIATGVNPTRLHLPTRNVACWVDLRDRQHPQLGYAAEFAKVLGAQLHVLCALPELTIPVALDPSIPLHPAAVVERLVSAVGDDSLAPRVLVTERDGTAERRKLLKQCNADVVFVPQASRPWFDWFGARTSWFHEPSSAVVMIPNEAAAPWVLQGRRARPQPQRGPVLTRRAS